MMKTTLLLLLLCGAAAHGEILLEQIAEFQLPPGSGAWDVQHWLDDSTFGWVAVVGDWGDQMIIYEKRLGEDRDTLILGDTLCDGTGDLLRLYAISIVKGEDDETYFALAAKIEPFGGYTILIMNPEDDDDDCFQYPLQNCSWTESAGLVPRELSVWPPPPARTQKVILSAVRSDYCDSMGDNDGWYYGRTYVISLAPFELFLDAMNVYSMRPKHGGDGFKPVGPGFYYRLYDDDTNPYDESEILRWTMLSYYNGLSYHVDTTCYQQTVFHPSYGFVRECETFGFAIGAASSGEERIAVHQTIFNGETYVRGTVCYDLETFERRWETTLFKASFEVAYAGSGGNVIWDGEQWKSYSFDDGSLVDSVITDGPRLWYSKTLDTEEGDTKLVRNYNNGQNRTIRLAKFAQPVHSTIVVAAIGEQLVLRWRPIPGAIGYQVCRMVDYSESSDCYDQVFTTSTTITLSPLAAVSREFFRVVPLFE